MTIIVHVKFSNLIKFLTNIYISFRSDEYEDFYNFEFPANSQIAKIKVTGYGGKISILEFVDKQNKTIHKIGDDEESHYKNYTIILQDSEYIIGGKSKNGDFLFHFEFMIIKLDV